MKLNYQEKQELNKLSKEIFGSSSRWTKLVDKGYRQVITEEVTEYVPAEDGGEGTTRTVKVPVKTKSGAFQYQYNRYTPESMKVYLLQLKSQLDEYIDAVKKQKEAQEKLALEQKAAHTQSIINELTGSSS